ncbi:MAG: hypothetical protein KAW47_05110 [Thermoplasmatales archaeon]|nr:hypothetical protein [Thermoplasmatales archaeon]
MINIKGPYPISQIPPIESDGCSSEVLIESHSGFYVGYYFNGDWYDAMNGDKLWKQFLPRRWFYLPTCGTKPLTSG